MLTGGLGPIYVSGECEIDLARRELRVLGSSVPVGGRAFEIVEILAQSAGELVTKDELMDRVWPGAIVNDNALQMHISAVRKALGAHRAMLKTESGRGYRLLGTWTARDQGVVAPQQLRVFEKTPATNIPAVATDLIGRSTAIQRLRDLASAYRVVTLTGPGGIGKTTLAVEVAGGLLAAFEGGTWIVELASLSAPDLVPSAVAGALGVRLSGEEISAEAVARAVGGTSLLLVLDNCEHVIDAAANFVEAFVRTCPRTTILATSRETLRINGEYVYRVPPLEVPAVGEEEPDQILGRSAVELFIARAKALDSDFSLQAETFPAIGAICRRLDGIPLAIEFAAARAATLGVQQVAAGLRNRFALLTGGRRTALPRHQTLRATLDWSYGLLPEVERLLLRRLAVFPGGFTLDAAVAVMNDIGLDASAVMDGTANLVAKSLVALDSSDAATRWSLLETIRAYALEKLTMDDEAGTVARHHATYYRDLFAPPASGARSRLSDDDLTHHVREIDNVRAALDWSFSSAGDPAIGVDITAAYAPVWLHLSLMAECRERCECALLNLDPHATVNNRLRMRLNIFLSRALFVTLGPAEQTKTVLIQALEAADTLDDFDAQARALSALVSTYVHRGEYGSARITVERLQQIAHRIDDPAIVRAADRLMGTTLVTIGKPREAQQYLERVLRSPGIPRSVIWDRSNDHAIARAMLARALWMQGFAEKAQDEAQKSLEELHEADHQLMLCRTLYYGICRIAPMTGDLAAADRAIARLSEVATRLDAPFWRTVGRFLEGKLLVERGEFARGLPVLRDAFETCARTGWRMSYPEFKGALAGALAGLGRLDEAISALDDAVASAGKGEDGQRWYVPELLRVKGEVLLQQAVGRSASSAEDCFNQAAEMAREQGALFWELRIALSLGRLKVARGDHDQARQILAPVYDRFTEGFGTVDMLSAKQLLESLSASRPS
jgi:predicted ATPase/DNA-binding winged helix-turn-helix (wHTH) protein